MSAEHRLLGDAIARRPSNACIADGNALLDAARYHRLTPRVFSWLREQPGDVAALMTALRTDVSQNARKNLGLLGHTIAIVRHLDASGIDALAIKGPVLAHQLSGDIARRVCFDVDVLVREAQFGAAARALAEIGYVTDVALDDASLRAQRLRRHDLAFAAADGTLIELHADIAQPHYSYRTDLSRWFERAVTVDFNGRSVRTLCPEHALVLAIVHGAKHLWARLDLVADVADLLRLPLDFDEVRARIDELGARRAAAVAFLLAGASTGPTDPVAARLARTIRQRLESRSEPSFWQARLFDLAIRERLSDRFRYAARLGAKLRV